MRDDFSDKKEDFLDATTSTRRLSFLNSRGFADRLESVILVHIGAVRFTKSSNEGYENAKGGRGSRMREGMRGSSKTRLIEEKRTRGQISS